MTAVVYLERSTRIAGPSRKSWTQVDYDTELLLVLMEVVTVPEEVIERLEILHRLASFLFT